MRTLPVIVLALLAIPASRTLHAARAATTAHYYLSAAGGGQATPISEAWIVADGSEKVHGRSYHWWRMIMRKPDGAILAIRALSERVPMTSDQAPGDIARYIYSPQPGIVLEYVNGRTGRALLPELDFEKSFLPHPSPDAAYVHGYADAGSLVGHVLRLEDDGVAPPEVTLDTPKLLRMNTDFIIATVGDFKDDGVIATSPDWDWHFVPLTEDDVRAKIAAGFNYFGLTDRVRPWVENEPVFCASDHPMYPDDLYRSNFTTTGMFLDEPMVILGWNAGIAGPIRGPEVVAQALRMRVASQDTLRDRLLVSPETSLGTLQLIRHKCPSWETEFWSAWYQLQAGAPGIVHEGRYKHRGYGWEPESLLGPGLEGLTDRDQFNFFFAFLRGAARSFDGDWGTSLYGHSDVDLRLPAFIRAYDMGAEYLWFWSSDHQHHMPFSEQLRIAKAITDYARQHPRPDRKVLLRRAEVGIALPPGYAFNWNGTWGMERERVNRFGVSYGDISAAMFWEGVLCSRRGMDYDFLVDHPGIEKLGYKRLIRIREDGRVVVTPPWAEERAPKDLRLDLRPATRSLISARQGVEADFRIERAGEVIVDGDLADWSRARWIALGGDKWYGDSFELTTKLTVSQKPVTAMGDQFQGFEFEQLSPELKERFALEAYPHEDMVVVTAIEPGSPADQAGLKVGDGIHYLGDRVVKNGLQIYQLAESLGDAGVGRELEVKVRRSGRNRYHGASDLSAEFAFMLDDRHLYFAAKVTDDVHIQHKHGPELWMHDSVQIGVDPILDRTLDNYGENDHELGFALSDGKVEVWSWKGRRGQPVGSPKGVLAQVVRKDGVTYYEAAIPLPQLMPFAPDLWPKCGVDVVVNDADEDGPRKGRLELVPGAMTHGKHPGHFGVFECAPSADLGKVSAGLIWDRRCMLQNGAAKLRLGIGSPQTREATVRAELTSQDSPQTRRQVREITIPVTSDPKQYVLRVSSRSPAGRYRLKVSVRSRSGWQAAEDALNVYIYPPARQR